MPQLRKSAVVSLVLWCLLVSAPPSYGGGLDLSSLHGHVAHTMELFKVPGLALGIVHKGEVVFLQGFGVRSVETGAPVDADTVFPVGSTTKAFTATLLCLLQEEGRLDLNAPVRDTLPEFMLSDPWVSAHVDTIDLLSHRSGILEHDMLWLWNEEHPDQDTIVQRLRFFPQEERFRDSFNYNNFMYVTAGKVMERITGKTWAANVRERITAPLGMDSVIFRVRELDMDANLAMPHQIQEDGGVARIPFRSMDNVAPAGCINASVRDMLAWAALHLGHAPESLPDKELLLAAARATHLPRIAMPAPEERLAESYPGAHTLSYGLGWFLHDYHGVQLVEHGGNIDGMTAMVALVPDLDLGLVILCNLDTSFVREALMYHVADLFLERTPGDWNRHFLDKAARYKERNKAEMDRQLTARKPGTSPSLPLDCYVGTYENPMFGTLDVRHKGKGLEFEILGRAAPLEHWHYDTFQRPCYDMVEPALELITFRLGQEGTVQGLDDTVMGAFEKREEKNEKKE